MEDCCGGQPELCAPLLDEVLGAAGPPATVIGPGTMAGGWPAVIAVPVFTRLFRETKRDG